MTQALHMPVMLAEVLEALAPKAGERMVDGTFGAGGYSKALLDAAQIQVFAIDRDPGVKALAARLEADYAGRFAFLAGSFSDMIALLEARGVEKVDGIVLDIGVSSMQVDSPGRGFSFRSNGPLDMRMSGEGGSAADLVNELPERELADVLYEYGEERASRRIARAICAARAEKKIETTAELAAIVRRVLPKKDKAVDPATRTFQALRIRVNDELGELERALTAAEALLAPGGRLVVVTFHSLEDRIVKRFFESRCGETGGASRHSPMTAGPRNRVLPTFFQAHKSAVKVSDDEAKRNPRARSAKLRSGTRSTHAAGQAA